MTRRWLAGRPSRHHRRADCERARVSRLFSNGAMPLTESWLALCDSLHFCSACPSEPGFAIGSQCASLSVRGSCSRAMPAVRWYFLVGSQPGTGGARIGPGTPPARHATQHRERRMFAQIIRQRGGAKMECKFAVI